MPRSIREPAVAGLFYPAEPEVLTRAVDALLADAAQHTVADRTRDTRVLVSPHAGYTYSGAVAARAFALIASRAVESVVLIGPSHTEAFSFTSVFEGDGYATPLGVLTVATATAQRLARAHASIRQSPRGHVAGGGRGEHGLEVILPFIQRACGEPTIVPVVMGTQSWDDCVALGRALAENVDMERALLVASSDLSHFYAYEEAVRKDAAFCDLLSGLDAARLHQALQSGRCEACGAGPVIACMLASEMWRDRQCRILARANSGDVTGERGSVVGYASAAVTTPAVS
jgi:MEMO1 family protein